MATYLVTGGAGYIGSHTCVALVEAGHEVVVFDNLSNSSRVVLDRVSELTGQSIPFIEGDMRRRADLERVFESHDIDGVVHFAGLKAVGESVEQPLAYYDNNVSGTVNLLHVLEDSGIRDLVFSSSATVYGQPDTVPVTEDAPVGAENPYGRTKLFIEEMLRDLAAAVAGWRIVCLRYFNPVGAHPSGRIGEDPVGIPNNLMPYAMQVAVGRRPHVNVFGDDYDTPDGTGVRDYIHVVDLATAHVAALRAIDRIDGWRAVNVGTGTGSSVLEVVDAVSRAIGRDLPYEIAPRRAGDVAAVYADCSLASDLLDWKATRDLDDMCRDHWRWQQENPNGYAES